MRRRTRSRSGTVEVARGDAYWSVVAATAARLETPTALALVSREAISAFIILKLY